jgi:Uma2 family endonuclease
MAAPKYFHQRISGEMFAQIHAFLKAKPCKVIAAPYDVRLFYEEEDGKNERDKTVVQPDISIVCDKKKRAPEGCRGAPDFVAEIISPSNGEFEMALKFRLYEKAGVKEYWLLDPERKTVVAYNFCDGAKKTYAAPDSAPLAHFPGLTIDLAVVFEED